MEVKYNSTKQARENEIQDLWSVIGTENLESNNFLGILGDTQEHLAIIEFLCSVIPNLLDSDIIQLCLLSNLIIEYNYLNSQMEGLKDGIYTYEPELADVMVPNCIYRNGCPEFHECGYFRKFIKWCKENNKDVDFFNIQSRYDAYNEFYKTEIGR